MRVLSLSKAASFSPLITPGLPGMIHKFFLFFVHSSTPPLPPYPRQPVVSSGDSSFIDDNFNSLYVEKGSFRVVDFAVRAGKQLKATRRSFLSPGLTSQHNTRHVQCTYRPALLSVWGAARPRRLSSLHALSSTSHRSTSHKKQKG